MSNFNEAQEAARNAEEARLNSMKPVRAWDRPMSFEVPSAPNARPGDVVRYEKRTVPIKYAVESVYLASTNARDRILARGILAIMEELEKK